MIDRRAMIELYRIPLVAPAQPGCADAALGAILIARLGYRPAIRRNSFGKPTVAGLELSISHSGQLALIAVCDAGSIGVDVEAHRPMADPVAFARRFFSPAEVADVADTPMAVFRLWCRKEAWLKAQGLGLDLVAARTDLRAAPPGWFIADLDVGSGYSAALARSGEPTNVVVRDLP